MFQMGHCPYVLALAQVNDLIEVLGEGDQDESVRDRVFLTLL